MLPSVAQDQTRARSIAPVVLRTASDSPVSEDSSTCRSATSTSRRSAGNDVARRQDHDVAYHEPARGQRGLLPVAQDGRVRRGHLAQRVDSLFGLVLLDESRARH